MVFSPSLYLTFMERGPGRHGISNAFFLYVRDPDGHRIELFTSDYLTVDPDLEPLRWSLTDPQRQTLWGHPAPKSWFEEGSEFLSVPVREPIMFPLIPIKILPNRFKIGTKIFISGLLPLLDMQITTSWGCTIPKSP